MTELPYQIITKSYQNNCFKISDSLIYFKREHAREEDQLDIDVFGDFWSLAFLPALNPEISVHLAKSKISFQGPVCFFIPPHSIVKWHIPKGELVWHALISTNPIRSRFANPVALPATIQPSQLSSEKSVEAWLAITQPLAQIGNAIDINIIAEKTKNFIDSHYQTDFHISQVSSSLNISNAYMTKEFKKCFGLSPIKYRNKKRVFKAMQVLMFSQYPIGQLAYEVGFHDYSRFSKNFHELMHATPREFRSSFPLVNPAGLLYDKDQSGL